MVIFFCKENAMKKFFIQFGSVLIIFLIGLFSIGKLLEKSEKKI